MTTPEREGRRRPGGHLQRVPPHDIYTEQLLLGAAMNWGEAARAVGELDPGIFYDPSHQTIAEAVVNLVADEATVDVGTVAAWLRERGRLDGIGGADIDGMHRQGVRYLAVCQSGTLSTSAVPSYAATVERLHSQRRVLGLASEIVEGIYSHTDIAGLVRELEAQIEATVEAESSTWEVVNLAAVLAGEGDESRPEWLRRTDGQGLLYPGRIHAFQAESESGKSWLALWACIERVESGEHVLYIDFEDEAADVVGRLLAMGADPAQLLDRFHYVRPDDPVDSAARLRVASMLKAWPIRLCVVDGVAEAMGMTGWNEDKAMDVVQFYTALPRAIARKGVGVILIDHLTKDREKQGNDARGSTHKRAGILVAYKLEVVELFGRNRTGRARVWVTKDRPGHVRGVAAMGGKLIAEMVLESTDDGTAVTLSVQPPSEDGGSGSGVWEGPTQCMAAVEALLVERAGEQLSGRAVETALRAKGAQYRGTTIRAALERMAMEGRCQAVTGPRRSRLYSVDVQDETLGDVF